MRGGVIVSRVPARMRTRDCRFFSRGMRMGEVLLLCFLELWRVWGGCALVVEGLALESWGGREGSKCSVDCWEFVSFRLRRSVRSAYADELVFLLVWLYEMSSRKI